MPEPEFYSAPFIHSLRLKARAAVTSNPAWYASLLGSLSFLTRRGDFTPIPSDRDGTWALSKRDPKAMLASFDCLSLKSGIKLGAYCYSSDLGSNCFVYALPRSARLPNPSLCSRSASHFLRPPVPPEAMDDVMAAISGDGSALSYLQASILAREMREFGAGWHGLTWSLQNILDQHPVTTVAEWKWLETVTEWRPYVSVDETAVRVVFYISCEYYCRRIVRNVDTYRPGSYCFATNESVVADGGQGLCF